MLSLNALHMPQTFEFNELRVMFYSEPHQGLCSPVFWNTDKLSLVTTLNISRKDDDLQISCKSEYFWEWEIVSTLWYAQITEWVARKCSIKKVFLESLQNIQKNTCTRVSKSATLLKKRLWQRCFPVNFAKFLRTPFLTEHLRWLFLYLLW